MDFVKILEVLGNFLKAVFSAGNYKVLDFFTAAATYLKSFVRPIRIVNSATKIATGKSVDDHINQSDQEKKIINDLGLNDFDAIKQESTFKKYGKFVANKALDLIGFITARTNIRAIILTSLILGGAFFLPTPLILGFAVAIVVGMAVEVFAEAGLNLYKQVKRNETLNERILLERLAIGLGYGLDDLTESPKTKDFLHRGLISDYVKVKSVDNLGNTNKPQSNSFINDKTFLGNLLPSLGVAGTFAASDIILTFVKLIALGPIMIAAAVSNAGITILGFIGQAIYQKHTNTHQSNDYGRKVKLTTEQADKIKDEALKGKVQKNNNEYWKLGNKACIEILKQRISKDFDISGIKNIDDLYKAANIIEGTLNPKDINNNKLDIIKEYGLKYLATAFKSVFWDNCLAPVISFFLGRDTKEGLDNEFKSVIYDASELKYGNETADITQDKTQARNNSYLNVALNLKTELSSEQNKNDPKAQTNLKNLREKVFTGQKDENSLSK